MCLVPLRIALFATRVNSGGTTQRLALHCQVAAVTSSDHFTPNSYEERQQLCSTHVPLTISSAVPGTRAYPRGPNAAACTAVPVARSTWLRPASSTKHEVILNRCSAEVGMCASHRPSQQARRPQASRSCAKPPKPGDAQRRALADTPSPHGYGRSSAAAQQRGHGTVTARARCFKCTWHIGNF